jgi:hypothetical protein
MVVPLFYAVFLLSALDALPVGKLLFGMFSPSSFGLTDAEASGLHADVNRLSFFWLPVLAGILAPKVYKFLAVFLPFSKWTCRWLWFLGYACTC